MDIKFVKGLSSIENKTTIAYTAMMRHFKLDGHAIW